MTKQEYLKQISRHLRCSAAKKKEITRQLGSHIEIALGEGRELSEILEEMGTPETIAAEFNENMDEKERKKGKGRRLLVVLAAVLAVLAVGGGYFYWRLPRSRDLNTSRVFDAEEVQKRSGEIITLFSREDYGEIDKWLTPEVREAMEEISFEEIRGYIGDDWGELVNIGNAYTVEVVERGKHYAVLQVNATYEKVSVTYTLSYNEEMQLYGFYVK